MRWGVVSTVLEPEPLVYAFVAHYHALGASTIDLFFDRPDPCLANELSKVPGCTVHQKTAEDWNLAGQIGPPSPSRRQAINAQECYVRANVDWLLHVDADEFLRSSKDVIQALQELPDTFDYLALAPLERVLIEGESDSQIFDGAFRKLVSVSQHQAIEEIYGPEIEYLDMGLSSNGRAKCFCRTGRNLVLGIHEPRDLDGGRVPGVMYDASVLLHFDGLTEKHFLGKLDRKISQNVGWRTFPAPGRQNQLWAIHDAKSDDGARHSVYTDAKCISADQARSLSELGLLERYNFDVLPAISQTFPQVEIDLSCRHFDSFELSEMDLRWYWRLWNGIRGRSYKLRQKFRKDHQPEGH